MQLKIPYRFGTHTTVFRTHGFWSKMRILYNLQRLTLLLVSQFWINKAAWFVIKMNLISTLKIGSLLTHITEARVTLSMLSRYRIVKFNVNFKGNIKEHLRALYAAPHNKLFFFQRVFYRTNQPIGTMFTGTLC